MQWNVKMKIYCACSYRDVVLPGWRGLWYGGTVVLEAGIQCYSQHLLSLQYVLQMFIP